MKKLEKRNKNQNSTTQHSALSTQHPFHNSGITLIALVVTVVVLLILAGVSLTLMLGDNNIFKLAKEAGDKTNEAIKSEQSQIDELNKWLTENGYGSENGGSGENPETPTIPEGLEVGSSVTYNLVGDDYIWSKEYATSDQTGTETLSSKDGGAFRLTQWKVLAINGTTVTLVPTKSTLGEDGTSGTVRLQGAQGYNNNVKLLNEACSKLYGNNSKGITARSINIKDIEDHMTETALTSAHSYADSATYGSQVTSPYTTYKNYPVIYAQEIKAVIGNEAEKDTGLGLSDAPNNFIERSEGTSTASSIGVITTSSSIQPYQTYWYKDETFMATAFENYKEGSSYYNLIMPQLTSTTYWVASRCVITFSDAGRFDVRSINLGSVDRTATYNSVNVPNGESLPLFPVVTLSSELIKADTNGNFNVNL